MVGLQDGGSSISQSYATGSVPGGFYTGGLVGQSGGSSISRSFAPGSVSGTNYVGGRVGVQAGGSLRRSCWARPTTGHSGGLGGGPSILFSAAGLAPPAARDLSSVAPTNA